MRGERRQPLTDRRSAPPEELDDAVRPDGALAGEVEAEPRVARSALARLEQRVERLELEQRAGLRELGADEQSSGVDVAAGEVSQREGDELRADQHGRGADVSPSAAATRLCGA